MTRFLPVLLTILGPSILLAADPKVDLNGDPFPPGVVMRLGETRFRPGVRVQYLAFSPDGTRLASWGNWLYIEDRFSVWDVATGKELVAVPTAENLIRGLRWAADGTGFALLARDVPTTLGGLQIVPVTGPSPDLPKPAGIRGGIRNGGGIRSAAEMYTAFDLSPDRKLLAAFRTGPSGTAVDLFETNSIITGGEPKKVTSINPKDNTCRGLQFVSGSNSLLVLTAANEKDAPSTATVHDLTTGKVVGSGEIPPLTAQGNRLTLDVSPDGKAVVCGSEDGTVTLVALDTGKKTWSISLPASPLGKGWDAVSAVKFVPGGKVFAAGRSNRQFVLDAATGRTLRELNGHSSWVEAVAVSPDGKRVATAGQDSLIRVWNAATWEPVAPPKGHTATIWKMDVSRDGRYAVTVGGEKRSRVWDLQTGSEVRSLPADPNGNTRFAPDGRSVLWTKDKAAVELYPLPDGPPTTLTPTGSLLGLSPDGKTLATAEGSSAGLLGLAGRDEAVRCGPRTGKPHTAAFTPDGRTCLLGYAGSNTPVDVADVTAGRLLAPLPAKTGGYSDMVAVVADGRTVFAFGANRIQVWDLVSRTNRTNFTPLVPTRGQHFYSIGFAVAHDGRTAATANSDGTVSLYETATGQLRKTLDGHRCSVLRVAFTPDGKRLISAGEDHTGLVWDVTFAGLAGPVTPIPAGEVAAAWGKLNAAPAPEAVLLLARLAADPKPAVSALAEKLRPVPSITDPKLLDRLVAELDDPVFAVREKASRDLDELGEAAVGGVRLRMSAVTSKEVSRRIEAFLKIYAAPTHGKDRLWEARAFEWLGSVETPEVVTLLKALAAGADGAWRTDQAKWLLSGRKK